MSATYVLVDLACLTLPLLASFYPKHPFFKEWRYFIPANLLVAVLFIIWDVVFTRMGVWGFSEEHLTGYYLAGLPLEEILFFVCIPYACVFTFFALKYLVKKNPLAPIQRAVTLFLSIALLFSGIYAHDKWYTYITFLLLGLYLLLLWIQKTDLSYHYLSYLLVLPFFFISNGILTGSLLESPVVWYNDLENLGIRMGTIPVEDLFYGYLLILLNIEVYRFLKGSFGGNLPE